MRRLLLVIMVLTLPAVATAGLYYLSLHVLEVTHRVIDPLTVRYLAIAEFALFTFGALLEARSRWSPSNR